jgi:hypothetical protein
MAHQRRESRGIVKTQLRFAPEIKTALLDLFTQATTMMLGVDIGGIGND